MKNIRLINKTTQAIIESSTTNTSKVLYSVPYGQYSIFVTEDGFEDYNNNIVVDSATETFNISMAIKNSEDYIMLKNYNIKANDPAFDNSSAILKAEEDALARGKNKTLVIPKGVYYISPNLKLKSGVNVIGEGARESELRIMPTAKNFWCIIHLDNAQDISIKNIKISSNHVERRRLGNIGDLHTNPQIGISMGTVTRNIFVDNVGMDTNGVWIISAHAGGAHSRNIHITNSDIKWTMGFATPDKPFVEGVTVDNTLIYFDSIGYSFVGNTVTTETGAANMTGIEAHGADGLVEDNTFIGVRTGTIPWNRVNDEDKGKPNNIVIRKNKFLNVLNGADIGLSPSRNFDGLEFTDNEILLKPEAFPGATFSRGIILGVWNAINGEESNNFTIARNRISSTNYQLPHADSNAYYNYYGIGIGSGVYNNLNIYDNIVENVPSFGLLVHNEVDKSVKINSGFIQGNTFKDTSKSLTNKGDVKLSAIRITERATVNTNGLTLGVNNIYDTRSETSTWYDFPTNMPIRPNFSKQNIVETKLKLTGTIVYDTRTSSPTFSMNSSNAYLQSFSRAVSGNTKYFVETNYPGDLWVSNSMSSPTQMKLSEGVSDVVTTTTSGSIVISGRPAKDMDGKPHSDNVTLLENTTYYFVIKQVD